jgi:hypothetical protein
LRATEQQTRRVESLEANRRPGVLDPAAHPAPPAIRYLPPGTALEISKPAGIPPSAGREFDRLRPDSSAATPSAKPSAKPSAPRASGADKAAAAAGAAPRPATPATHSPLDLLFHSQN